MCVLAFAWHTHPRWRLVMAGNRDELHARPAAPLARWDTPDHVIAGRDLAAGGSWLGVSEQGRFAVVTNLRGFGLPLPDRASRGALVRDLLAGDGPYAASDAIDLAAFNPFNLIFVDCEGPRFLTNQPTPMQAALPPGLYGLSNGALDEPWPKTVQIKSQLLDWIVAGAGDPAALLDGLANETLPDAGLPPDAPSDAPLEPRLSPIFIRNPMYGTRCSTVVAIGTDGQGLIVERRYNAAGAVTGETKIDFSWPG